MNYRDAVERTQADLLKRLREIDADERFHYPSANVVINAPLALIQLGMETQARTIQETLQLLGYDGPELQIRSGPRAALAGEGK